MSQALLIPLGFFIGGLLAAMVIARMMGRSVWLGAVAAAGYGIWLALGTVPGQADGSNLVGAVFLVGPTVIGWVIGSLIGLRQRGRG